LLFQLFLCMGGMDSVLVLFHRVWAKHTLGNRIMEVYDDVCYVFGTRSGTGSKPCVGLDVLE